jgi:hypothetical protein
VHPARTAALLAAAGTGMALFGVAGHSRISGPVILRITRQHGVHLDDLLVFACWVIVLEFAWRISRR